MNSRKGFGRIVPVILMLMLVLLGCSKEENPDLNVLNHDFTEQEWSDFYDAKMAAQATEAAQRSESASGGSASGKSTDNSGSSKNNSGSDNSGTSEGNGKGQDSDSSGSSSDDRTVVIVIDPGHGGRFTGAVSNGVNEKDITLKTARYVKSYLEENYTNVEVYLTREKDEDLADNLVDDLENRARIAAKHKADALVSIHFNASDGHNRTGTYIYVSRRKHVSEECRGLARAIMDRLVELGTTERAIEERKSNDMFDEDGNAYDYYAINRHCAARNIPGIIVEQCFMDNADDRQFINTDKALKSLGEANAKGIADYYGLKKKE